MAEGMLDNPGAVTDEDPTEISKEARDVAKATGVAYEDIATEAESDTMGDSADYDNAGITTDVGALNVPTGLSSVDAKSTVAGQLNTLLASDSPYLAEARRAGQEQAASRGMLNTSMAAGASQREAIKAATPIAQQDAQTFAQAQQIEQKAKTEMQTMQAEGIVSAGLVEQQANIERNKQNIQNRFTALLQGASEQNKVWLNDMMGKHDAKMQEMQIAANAIMQSEQISGERANMVRQLAAQTMQNYQISVENMMTHPDFIDLGDVAVNNALTELQILATSTIGFLGASAGMEIEMDALLDQYFGEINVLGEGAGDVDDYADPSEEP
jgi:hypothetical protein